MGDREFYHRHLPHYQPADATFFVTFRLAGSLPRAVVEQLRAEREIFRRISSLGRNERERVEQKREWSKAYFKKFESLLDGRSLGPTWLRKPSIAGIVSEALHYRDGKFYDLIAYCVMPNHVHVIFSTEGFSVRRADCPTNTVTDILQKLKWNTAIKANAVLGRSGAFWQGESYDHVVRDEDELERIIEYVLDNPVKAGLVRDWREWIWSYVRKDFLE